MARTKKTGRNTSFVTLRQKSVSKGRISLYLDIYKDGVRKYEFLKLYLVPETDTTTKNQNKNTLQAATAIRNQRELEIIQGKGGIQENKTINNISLIDWLQVYKKLKEETGQSNSRAQSVELLIKHIGIFKNNIKLQDIDETFCKSFIAYLNTAKLCRNTKNKKIISKSSANLYFSVFSSALNEAVRKKLIPVNPVNNLNREEKKTIKAEKSNRSFLTIEDVKKLIDTDCNNLANKQAFLFSCFTGLRLSDILNLTWDNIIERDNNFYLSIITQKTKKPLTIKLNKQAINWLPLHKDKYVFGNDIYRYSINRGLKKWAKKAGVKKDLCFHIARHTFATMELTLGADLYVVSKLLGHTNVGTTQIYADIINKRRDEAIELIDNAF